MEVDFADITVDRRGEPPSCRWPDRGRQRPGSAKCVMFLTMKDETGAANVVVWVKVFEKFRRVLLSSVMLGVRGRVQREGEVVHLVAHELTDLSPELDNVGNRETPFPLPHGHGDEAYHGGSGLIRGECRRAETSSIPILTLHAAGGVGNGRRRVVSVRFLGDDIRHAPRDWKTSPSFPGLEQEIAAGAPMAHPLFPVIWEQVSSTQQDGRPATEASRVYMISNQAAL